MVVMHKKRFHSKPSRLLVITSGFLFSSILTTPTIVYGVGEEKICSEEESYKITLKNLIKKAPKKFKEGPQDANFTAIDSLDNFQSSYLLKCLKTFNWYGGSTLYKEDILSASKIVSNIKDDCFFDFYESLSCFKNNSIFLIDALKDLPKETLFKVVPRLNNSFANQMGDELVTFISLIKDMEKEEWEMTQHSLGSLMGEGFVPWKSKEMIKCLLESFKELAKEVPYAILTHIGSLKIKRVRVSYEEDKILTEILRNLNHAQWKQILTYLATFASKIKEIEQIIMVTKVVKNMNSTSFLNKTKTEHEIATFIKILEALTMEERRIVLPRLIRFIDKMENGDQIDAFIALVKGMKDEKWTEILGCLNYFEKKMENGEQITSFMTLVKDLDYTNWKKMLVRLSPFYDTKKMENGGQIVSFIAAVKDIQEQQWTEVQARLSHFAHKMENGDQIACFIAFAKQMKDTRWDRLLANLSRYGSRVIEERINIIISFINDFNPKKLEHTHIESSLNALSQKLNAPSLGIEIIFFLLMKGSAVPTPEAKEFWINKILQETPSNAEQIVLRSIMDLGEEHPITQEFIHCALGKIQQAEKGSFLYAHQRMNETAKEFSTHRPRIMGGNTNEDKKPLTLSVEKIAIPRPKKDIPFMSVGIWEKLFDEYESYFAKNEKDLQSLSEMTNFSLLFELKDNYALRSMLDPKNTFIASSHVSTTSYQLRHALKQVNESFDRNEAMLKFHQFLLNVQTCPTGKEEGIMHTFRLLKNEKALDENNLGSHRFMEEIESFITEELRRLREAALSKVLSYLKLIPEPHSLHYVRGVLGGEVGLLFEGEQLKLDINGNNLPQSLLSLNKQELLNTFYLYYKPEDIIDRVHMLLNNGSITVGSKWGKESKEAQAQTTATIMNLYFSTLTTKFDEKYTVMDSKGIFPIGTTPFVAQQLLRQLGFLFE